MSEFINNMKLTIDAKSCNESFARSVVAAFFTQLNPSIEELNDVKTAVSEAVTNCIVHGYDRDSSGVIDITSKLTEDTIFITIQDYGKGITNISQAMQPFYTTKSSEERSGMGFTVMEAFTDKLEVISTLDNGTQINMTKKIKK